jgi:energy-coupling factor transporter ATP-binding protein EcfA2
VAGGKDARPVIVLAFANEQVGRARYLRKLSIELQRVRDVLEQHAPDGPCELVVRPNVTLAELFNVFQDRRYRNRVAIFHFAGHAGGLQLLLESSAGEPVPAHAEGLAAFLGQQQGLQLVFLNGCSTQPQVAGLLSAGIRAVIATSEAINDAVATDFSHRFYGALAGDASIDRAYKEAVASILTAHEGTSRDLYSEETPEAQGLPWELYVHPDDVAVRNWNLATPRREHEAQNVLEVRKRYRASVAIALSRMDVPAAPVADGLPAPRLEDIFVEPEFEQVSISSQTRSSGETWSSASPTHSTLDLTAWLRRSQHVVVLGDMGAGKSTLLKFIALELALDDSASRLHLHEGRLPLVVDLSMYADRRRDGKASSLEEYLRQEVRRMLPLDAAEADDFFSAELRAGAFCLCLDGLDKVGTPQERQGIVRDISALAAAPTNGRLMRIVVSSRHAGYHEAALDERQFSAWRLLAPSREKIADLLRKWCGDQSEALARSLERGGIEVGTFLLATIAALNHRADGLLPGDDDAGSLGSFVDRLLDQWDRDSTIQEHERELDFYRRRHALLSAVGYSLQSEQHGDGRGMWAPSQKLEQLAAKELQRELPHSREETQRQARRFIDLLCHRSGLLVSRAGDATSSGRTEYSFWHPSLQECLAAGYIAGKMAESPDDGWTLLAPYLGDARWENVVTLTLGCWHRDGLSAGIIFDHLLSSSAPFEHVLHRSLFLAARVAARVGWLPESDARPIIDRLVGMIEGGAPAWVPALQCLISLGRYPAAVGHILRILAPEDCHSSWILLAAHALPPDRARSLSGRVQAIAMNVEETWANPLEACRLLHRLGRTQQARTIIRQGLRHDDSRLRVDEAVETLLAIGAESDALEILVEPAADGSQRDWWNLVRGAEAFERVRRRADAIELLERLDEQSYWGDLGAVFLLERLDRPTDAQRALRKGLEISSRAWAVAPELVARAPELRQEAIGRLEQIAHDPQLDGSTLAATINSLVAIGGASPDPSPLLRLVGEPRIIRQTGGYLIQELLRRDQGRQVILRLSECLSRADLSQAERAEASFHYAWVVLSAGGAASRQTVEEAVTTLSRMALDSSTWEGRRHECAEALAKQGYASEAAAAYLSIAIDGKVALWHRGKATNKLIELGEMESAVAAAISMHAQGATWADISEMATQLLDVGRSEGAARLIERLAQHISSPYEAGEVKTVTELLVRTGNALEAERIRNDAREWALAEMIPDQDGDLFRDTPRVLYTLGEMKAATEVLLRIGRTESKAAEVRTWALSTVAMEDPQHRDEALGILADMSEDSSLGIDDRRMAWSDLERLVVASAV